MRQSYTKMWEVRSVIFNKYKIIIDKATNITDITTSLNIIFSHIRKLLSSILMPFTLMNTYSGRNFDNSEGNTIAVMTIAGIIVATGLLSALYLVGGYQQPVIAQEQQQNTIGGLETSTGNQASSVTTTNDTNTTTTAGFAEGENATNATTTATGAEGVPLGGNQLEIKVQLEEAVMALQNNDTEGALMHLDLALNALRMSANNTIVGSSVNTTGSAQEEILALVEERNSVDEDNDGAQDGNNNNNDNDESADSTADGNVDGGNNAAQSTTNNANADSQETNTEEGEASECGAVNIGGTSPADDYGCPPDPDA